MQVMAYRSNGDTSNIERVFLYKDSGATAGTEGDPITGLSHTSTGLNISTIANNEATANTDTSAATSSIETVTTLGTYSAPTAGFVRFKEVDATNMPGLYEIQWENARYAVSSAIWLDIAISGVADLAPYHGRIYLKALPANIEEYLDVAVTGTLITAAEVGLLYKSAITTVTSPTEFVMTTAFAVDDSWVGNAVTLVDDSSGLFYSGNIWISDAFQATNTLHINAAFPVTVTTSDSLLVRDRQHPTYALNTKDVAGASDLTAVKGKTDQLNFGVTNAVDANITNVAGGSDIAAGGTGDQEYGES